MGIPKGRLELTWMGKDKSLIPSEEGLYDYAWVEPTDPRACEVRTIEIVERIGSLEGETGSSENLLIQGDSGDTLRSLGAVPEWADKYVGQVKLVYIDPPFNTAQTFEQYADQLEHSVWLTMMRDRIRDIKPLLSVDASVWVHLDDAEVHRMRMVLDEELGSENFIAEISWQKADSPNNSAKYLSKDQDTILVYARQKESWRPNKLPRTAGMDAIYANPDDDPRGRWYPGDPYANKPYSLGLYTVTGPTGRTFTPPPGRFWRISEAKFRDLQQDNRIWWGPNGDARPSLKRFLSEVSGSTPRTMWLHQEVGSNRTSKNEMRSLFPGLSSFATPKPERLLERVLQIGSNAGDLVLDCFAGSGTTAAVAHKMGRRWVAVELQQNTVDQYLIPRLSKVVSGEDTGGISVKKERVADTDLPDGVEPEEAQKFTSLLSKIANNLEGLDPATVRALKAATKTKTETRVLWSGGGGFTVARLGASMYEVDEEDGEVYLSPAAVNGAWSKAMAGQMRYRLIPNDGIFVGERNRRRLAVADGVVDEAVVKTIVANLDDGQTALIVGKSILPEAVTLLAELAPGSLLKKAPDDLFPKATVK